MGHSNVDDAVDDVGSYWRCLRSSAATVTATLNRTFSTNDPFEQRTYTIAMNLNFTWISFTRAENLFVIVNQKDYAFKVNLISINLLGLVDCRIATEPTYGCKVYYVYASFLPAFRLNICIQMKFLMFVCTERRMYIVHLAMDVRQISTKEENIVIMMWN